MLFSIKKKEEKEEEMMEGDKWVMGQVIALMILPTDSPMKIRDGKL